MASVADRAGLATPTPREHRDASRCVVNDSSNSPPAYSWEGLLQEVRESGEFSVEWVTRFEDAIDLLRGELGELKTESNGLPDPRMFWALTNRAPWTRERVLWIAEILRRCKPCRNYETIRRELDHARRFGPGVEVLETAEVFLDAGLSVDFGPLTQREGEEASPDFEVQHQHSGERLIVEVTHLSNPKVMRDATRNMTALIDIVSRWALAESPPLNWAGRFHVYLPDSQLELLSSWIRDLAHRVRVRKGVEAIAMSGHFEIALAPETAVKELEAWAVRRSLSVGELSGPTFDSKESRRVSMRVSAKVRQLADGIPGVILVNDSRVIPGDLKLPDSLGDRSEIREIMTRYPSLLCVVLCAHVHRDAPTTEIPPPLPPSMNVATRWLHPG